MSSSPDDPTPPRDNTSGVIPLESVENPILRQGIDYWRALKGDRTYPSRADMNPRGLTPLLRHVVLLRLLDGGADYEYRIVGDAHVMAHGFSMQGKRLSEIDAIVPGYGAILKSLYDRAVRRREAYAFRGWLEPRGGIKQHIYSESVFMPLGPDETTVDHVLNFSVYSPRDGFEF